SLAVSQGAKPEELITAPAERSTTAPEWVSAAETQPTAASLPVDDSPSTEEPLSALVTGPGTSASDQDDALAWLESLAVSQGAKPEELITAPAERSATAPEWVSAAETQNTAASLPVDDSLSTEEPLSAFDSAPGADGSDQDDELGWLESLTRTKAAEPEELNITPIESAESLPDWMSELPEADSLPVAEEPLSTTISITGESASDQDDELGWLESLTPYQAANPEEAAAAPVESAESLPDWMTGLPVAEDLPAVEEPISAATSAADQEDNLDWLELPAFSQNTSPQEPTTQPVYPEESAPAWVSSLPPVNEREAEILIDNQTPTAEAAITALTTGASPTDQVEARAWLDALAQKLDENSSSEPREAEILIDNQTPAAEAAVAALISSSGAGMPSQDSSLTWLDSLPQLNENSPSTPTTDDLAAAQLSETRPNRLTQTVPTQPVSSAESQPEPATTSPDWAKDLVPVNPETVESMPEPDLRELGTASAGFAEEIAAEEDFDWLGDLSLPAAERTPQVSEPVDISTLEANSAIVNLPDAPDVSLDWLTGVPREPVSLATDSATDSSEATMLVEPAPDEIEQASDWYASLAETDTISPTETMPWEHETPSAVSPLEELTPIPFDPDEETSEPALEQPGSQEFAHLHWEPADLDLESGQTSPSAPITTQPQFEPDPITSEQDEAPAWLASLDDVEEPKPVEPLVWEPVASANEMMSWEHESTPETAVPLPQPSSDIAEWLDHLDNHSEEDDSVPSSSTWLSPISAPVQPAEKELEELPDWLKDPDAPAQAAPAPDHETTTAEKQPEVLTVPASPEPVVEAIQSPPEVKPEVQPQVQPQVQPRAIPPGNDKDAQTMQKARELLKNNNLLDSMTEYSRLIRKGKMLEEVIHDLQETVYRHPVDVIIWQTLGDAYFRVNRLQEALDAYGKAEGLLR
ncbi:MAG: hypothetical protein NTW32_01645, partial [Chloroflexi bacterium]|nr:hypothetical protein [Chloroflexota bacterium]